MSTINEFAALKSVLQALIKTQEEEVLEIGCGHGEFTKILATFCSHVTAVDVDSEALNATAAKGMENVTLRQTKTKGETFDFIQSGSLDAVFFYRSLHFIQEAENMLTFMNRLLKPGGRIVIIHRPQIQLSYSQDSDLGYLLNSQYQRFCSEMFADELASYWSPTTSQNFIRYCDPERSQHSLPLKNYNHLSVPVKKQIHILEVKSEMLESTVASNFMRKKTENKKKFENAYQTWLENVCDLLDFPLEEIIFSTDDEFFCIEKKVEYYVQINTK